MKSKIVMLILVILLVNCKTQIKEEQKTNIQYNYNQLDFNDFTSGDIERTEFPYSGNFNIDNEKITLVITKPDGDTKIENYRVKSYSWDTDSTALEYKTNRGTFKIYYKIDSITCIMASSPGQTSLFYNKTE